MVFKFHLFQVIVQDLETARDDEHDDLLELVVDSENEHYPENGEDMENILDISKNQTNPSLMVISCEVTLRSMYSQRRL
jgi:hypothetical protein